MTWRSLLKDNIISAQQLRENSPPMSDEEFKQIEAVLEQFPMSISKYYYSLIHWDDVPDDPIYRQCVPAIYEEELSGSFDTSGEADNTKQRGLQHKYEPTTLVLTTNACAMYCRHCFRKRLVGISDQNETGISPDDVRAYVISHPEVNNVLLSGGDALLNSTELIREYLSKLLYLPQIDFVRIGSRIPVTFPARITEDEDLLKVLAHLIKDSGKRIFLITQFNHPREITAESRRAISLLQKAGLVIRNQTVLLKGVNDNSQVLKELMASLTGISVIPYYVFQCRPVSGVKNQFQVPLERGCRLIEETRAGLDGQSKCFRFVMSHPSGKIEILGITPDKQLLLKYHQAKDKKDHGRIFSMPLEDGQAWI